MCWIWTGSDVDDEGGKWRNEHVELDQRDEANDEDDQCSDEELQEYDDDDMDDFIVDRSKSRRSNNQNEAYGIFLLNIIHKSYVYVVQENDWSIRRQ